MNHASPSPEQTARTVFWILMAGTAGFAALVWILIR